jgi:hypothetical protein
VGSDLDPTLERKKCVKISPIFLSMWTMVNFSFRFGHGLCVLSRIVDSWTTVSAKLFIFRFMDTNL